MSNKKRADSDAEQKLTKEHREELDRVFESALEFFKTPAGIEMSGQIDSLLPRLNHKPASEPVLLSENEERALTFIKAELKRGRSPSVREVAKMVGLRSSRSGLRLVNSLKSKNLLGKN